MQSAEKDRAEGFEGFLVKVEPRLRRALVATYGPVDGRDATGDALSWAWEHWDHVSQMQHPVAYLYRVGQSAMRRFGSKPLPGELLSLAAVHMPEISPELWPALGRLSAQQRTIVLLVHGFGWPQSEVAELLDVNPSTVREHLQRGLTRLRTELAVPDAC